MSKNKSQPKANLSYIPANDTFWKLFYKKHVWTIFAVIAAILGIAASAVSINYGLERQYILNNGVSTTGTITAFYTKLESSWYAKAGPGFVDYKTIVFPQTNSSETHSFDVRKKDGDVVGKEQPVTFLKDNPSRAVVTNEAQFQDIAFWFTIPAFGLAVFIFLWLPRKLMSK